MTMLAMPRIELDGRKLSVAYALQKSRQEEEEGGVSENEILVFSRWTNIDIS